MIFMADRMRNVIEEGLNKGNLSVFDEIQAPNFVFHSAGSGDLDRAGFKQFITAVRTAFPAEMAGNVIGEGDTAAIRLHVTGTQQNEFQGIPPTNKFIDMTEGLFFRYEGDKVVEEWQHINQLEMLQQPGVYPTSG
jgi:predicted ester cyclase